MKERSHVDLAFEFLHEMAHALFHMSRYKDKRFLKDYFKKHKNQGIAHHYAMMEMYGQGEEGKNQWLKILKELPKTIKSAGGDSMITDSHYLSYMLSRSYFYQHDGKVVEMNILGWKDMSQEVKDNHFKRSNILRKTYK